MMKIKIAAIVSAFAFSSVSAQGIAPTESISANVPCYPIKDIANYILNQREENVVFEGTSGFKLDGEPSPVFVVTYNPTSKEYTALVEFKSKVCVYDFGKGKFNLGEIIGTGKLVSQ